MKNISTVLNAVLLVAVAVLYYLHFSNAKPATEEVAGGTKASDLAIAYINSDSLVSKYEFFKQISEQLEAKRTKLEAEYTNRAQGLQTEIENFQRNANSMTIGQAKAAEEDLMKKQQNLMRYQEALGQELMAEESKLQNELYDKVADYLAEYGKANNLQLVLTYSKGSGVIFANDSLNITDQVLKGLNDSFSNEAAPSTEK